MVLRLEDWPLGPATSLVLLGSAFVVALAVAGGVVASNPRRGRPPSGEVAEQLARSARLRRYLRRRFDPGRATGLALTAALLVIFLAAVAFGQVADMVTSRTGLYRFDAAAAGWGAAHATRASTIVLVRLTALGSTTVVSGWSFPSGHTAAAAVTYAAVALLLGRGRRWPVKAWLGTATAAVILAVASSRVLLGVHWLTDVIAGAALGFAWFAACSIAFGGTLLRFGATAEQARAAAQREEANPRGDPG